ncbi:MAG: hypothetical protein JKY42_09025 [Flavobacteriales bacterium]|nr:hypothetical protein [Flavobacteriales bacterium]
MKKAFYILLLVISFSIDSYAQFFQEANSWKAYRKEYTVGGGVSNYNGDLGGLDLPQGINFFLFDMELTTFKYGFYGSYRYNLNHRHASSVSLFYGKIMGDDKLTNNIYRNNRNLNFTSVIWELTWNYEFYIIRQSPGHLYNIKGAKGLKGNKWDMYLFIGVGAFYYNPKSNGVPLRMLGTEGQGIPGERPMYSPISLAFPVGFGGSYRISKKIKIGTEFSYRFTTTDYLDDVSGNYYSKDKLKQYKGSISATLSDPSMGANPGWTVEGEQRGDPKYKDGYLSFLIKVTYLPKKKYSGAKTGRPGGKHSFNKRKKRRKIGY